MTSNDDIPDDGSGPEEDEGTKVAKRSERLEQNRISARESRKRKKNMIEELQRTVITLSRENKELNERNEALRRELVEIGTQNPGVVNIQALMTCSGPSAAAEGGSTSSQAGGAEEGGTSASAAPADKETADNPVPNPIVGSGTAANPQSAQNQLQQQQQQQAAALVGLSGINPQQLAVMQQMMALQQAGMMPQMMGMAGMMGMPGAGAGGTSYGQQQQQQQQQHQQPPSTEAPK